ncbi:MAG: RrF2 family transcriptional regulator [Ignavibacteria bacterium]
MQLTLAGEYAIRTMIHLAENEDRGVITINEIAKEQKIPEKFLRKIIPKLCNAGLVKTYKGNGGGISFNKDPDLITPLEIIQAIEGPLALNKCLIDKAFCSNTRWCSVHTLWCDLLVEMRRKLSSKSIKTLAIESTARRNQLKKIINN